MSTLPELKASTLSKSQYNEARHIPSAHPLKRTSPDKKDSVNVTPTKLPVAKRQTPSKYDDEIKMSISGHQKREGTKRTHPSEDFSLKMSEKEFMLAQELDRVVEELDRWKQENGHLEAENAKLRQEKDIIMAQYDRQIESIKSTEEYRFDLERKLRLIEMEQTKFEEEIRKAYIAKKSAEDQLEAYRNQIENTNDLDEKLEVVLAERNYFESQLKQAKAIQINLEQEIRQKADERAQLISNYEVRISALQNDITILKSQKEGESLRQSQNLIRFQSENEILLNEINNLKGVKKNLEAQINKLRNENLNVDDEVRQKLAESETIKRNTLALLEKEKKASEALRALLQQKTEEFDLKEAEFNRLYDERTKELSHLETKLAQTEKLQVNNVLLTEEVERLQCIITEKMHEIEELKKAHMLEMNKIQNAYLQPLRSSTSEYEKVDTYPDMHILNKMIDDYEANAKNLVEDLNGKQSSRYNLSAQRMNEERQKPSHENEQVKKSYNQRNIPTEGSQDEYGNNYNLSVGRLDSLGDSASIPIHEDYVLPVRGTTEPIRRAGALAPATEEVESLKTDCRNLQEIVKNLNEQIMRQEEKNVMLMIEVERLGCIVGELQDENEALDHRLREQDEAYLQQVAGLEKQYEQATKSQLENEIRNLVKNFTRDKSNLEAEMHRQKLKIDDLEETNTILKTEVMRLQQANVAKGKESDEWKIRCDELTRENLILRENLEGELRKKLAQEISGLNSKWAKEKLEYENESSQLKMQIAELENKRVLLITENERLLRVIKERDHEIENWRGRLVEAEQEYQNQVGKIKEQLEVQFRQRLESEIANRMIQSESEKGILEKNLQNVKGKMVIYEEQITNFNRDIQLLKQELADKIHQIEELNAKIAYLSESQQEIEAWKNKYSQLQKTKEQEYKDLKNQFENIIQSRENEINSMQIRILEAKTETENQVKMMLTQNKELEEKLKNYSGEIEKLKQLNTAIQSDNEKLKKQKKELENTIVSNKANHETELKKKLEKETVKLMNKHVEEKTKLQDVSNEFKIRCQDYECRMILFSIEIERLHEIMVEKENEVTLWREKIFEQESTYNATIDELRRQFEIMLQNRIELELREAEDKFHQEKQSLELEIASLKSQSKKQEESLQLLISDNQNLRDELNQKDANIEKLHQRINKFQAENENYGDIIRKDIQAKLIVEFENQMKDLMLRFTNERTALESQIRQMKNRITEMENEMEQAQDHHEKLVAEIQGKHEEIDTIRNRYTELEKHSAARVADLHDKFERQKTKEIDEVAERIKNQHQNEASELLEQIKSLETQVLKLEQKIQDYENNITLLGKEVEKLNAQNMNKCRELEDVKLAYETMRNNHQKELRNLQERIRTENDEEQDKLIRDFNLQLSRQKQEHEDEIRQMKQAILEYENNLKLMVDEVERLTTLLNNKDEEIGLWRNKLNAVEKTKEQEREEIRRAYEKDRNAQDNKLREANYKLNELQKTYGILNSESERLKLMCEEIRNEANMWKEKYNDLDNAKYLEIEEIRTQFETLKRSSLHAGDYEVRLQAERTAFGTQIMQLKQKITEMDTHIEDLTKENHRLNQLYVEKKKEVDTLKNNHGEIEHDSYEELKHLRKENEHLRRALSKLLKEREENLARSEFDKTNSEAQINQLKQALDLRKVELMKLHEKLNNRKSENEAVTLELILQLDTARQEIAQTVRQYKELEAEYLRLVSSYEHLHQEIEDIKHSRDIYKAQFEQNNIDIAKKNKELIEKLQQVDVLKSKYEEAIANVEPIRTSSKVVTKMTIKK